MKVTRVREKVHKIKDPGSICNYWIEGIQDIDWKQKTSFRPQGSWKSAQNQVPDHYGLNSAQLFPESKNYLSLAHNIKYNKP